jgi:hypothetical protein
MNEKYEDLKVFETSFEISNTGKVRRKNNKEIVNTTKSKSGYYTLYLNAKKYQLHKLMAIQYIKNPKNYRFVGFKDGDRDNLNRSNICWKKSNDRKNYTPAKKTRPKTAEPKITAEKINEKLNDLGENINTYSKSYTKDRYIPIIDK